MKVFSFVHKYDFSWDLVSQALWLKYPNPSSSHVLSSDILYRSVDVNGVLHTVRLLLKTSPLPSWGKTVCFNLNAKLINIPEAYIVEKSSIDPAHKIMTVQSSNISYTGLLRVLEHQTYYSHPENSNW